MDRATRSELVKTVDAQKEKLQKYETKLRGNLYFYLYKKKGESTLAVFSDFRIPWWIPTEICIVVMKKLQINICINIITTIQELLLSGFDRPICHQEQKGIFIYLMYMCKLVPK